MIILLLLVIPVDATGGCCSNNFTVCGNNILHSCYTFDTQEEALYRCTIDEDLIGIQICMNDCLETQTGEDFCAKAIPRGTHIPAGGSLRSGEYISADTNRTQLILQDDGNLVLYRYDRSPYLPTTRRRVLWNTATNTNSGDPKNQWNSRLRSTALLVFEVKTTLLFGACKAQTIVSLLCGTRVFRN